MEFSYRTYFEIKYLLIISKTVDVISSEQIKEIA